MQYKCKKCGCEEFITQPNKYDIYENQNGKLVLKASKYTDTESELFCRECSEKLKFKEEDIEI